MLTPDQRSVPFLPPLRTLFLLADPVYALCALYALHALYVMYALYASYVLYALHALYVLHALYALHALRAFECFVCMSRSLKSTCGIAPPPCRS